MAILIALYCLGDTATGRPLRANYHTDTVLDQSCSSLQLHHRVEKWRVLESPIGRAEASRPPVLLAKRLNSFTDNGPSGSDV